MKFALEAQIMVSEVERLTPGSYTMGWKRGDEPDFTGRVRRD